MLKLIYRILFLGLVTQCLQCKSVQEKTTNSDPVDRLLDAYEVKSDLLMGLLAKQNLSFDGFEVLVRVFKEEEELEVWTRKKGTQQYSLLKTYPFCKSSGILGPKRKEGDRQIPEGIYRIDRFNPNSSYYLSLGLNYPNKSDLILGDKNSPGSNIFIHGDCLTVGCIPITNDKIKEVYVLAEQAKRNGQNMIYVHLFPAKLTKNKHKNLIKQYPQHASLWTPLRNIYLQFEETHIIPYVLINNQGLYQIKE